MSDGDDVTAASSRTPGRTRADSGRAFRAYAQGLLETGSVRVGLPLPLGTEIRDGGVNFAVFSRHATQVWLEIYDDPEAGEPVQVIGLDPQSNRTGDIWHVWVEGLAPGTLYGYRVDGPYRPREGHCFNPHKLLIDPYTRAVCHVDGWDFDLARGSQQASREAPGNGAVSDDRDHGASGTPTNDRPEPDPYDNAAEAPKSVVVVDHFDWKGDTPLRRPWSETVIYEAHVRGFTKHPSADVDHPGTFRGLVERIPYLKSLGVTAVELLPVQEFNEGEISRSNPVTGDPLRNFWGYNPAAFMAPNAQYSSAGGQGEQVLEFKQMVRAFHEAGIEVILDVVFNHTGEGNHLGPTFSWRGFDNSVYYLLDHRKDRYRDYTGTGNTIKADHPVVRELILDALRAWVMEMHVDGFRFDLASVLGRDQDGNLLADPPLIERIAEDPILRDVKIIAEAWDAAGAYQVGSFSRHRWAEWNGQYRDTVRRFWRGDTGVAADFASRIAGSADLYADSGRSPHSSINYITSHDGFTLNDLVSYNHKHNEENGENNRDGTDANYSYNYGVEGPTDDPSIESVRDRQVRNFILTLMLSRGVPMLLGGDEFRRTQDGNNNAYCQDNETGWVNWSRAEEHADLVRFSRHAIGLRSSLLVLAKGRYYSPQDLEWFDAAGRAVDWDRDEVRTLGMHIRDPEKRDVMAVFHAGPAPMDVSLPDPPVGLQWHRVADTALPAPKDIVTVENAPVLFRSNRFAEYSHRMQGRSTLLVVAKRS